MNAFYDHDKRMGAYLKAKAYLLLRVILLTLILSACASSDDGNRMPSSYNEDGSNAHPAAYLTDLFQVHRPLPKHEKKAEVEFYFKKCNMAGDNWPISHTSYDCTYP